MQNEYQCIGKRYNGEPAVISLTSWRGRISTVGLTIYSLLKNCPGYHIVLVLSIDEFKSKQDELPCVLVDLVNARLIEILWVQHNYKSFKKVLFTMDKYRTVPIISADDDCFYTKNYSSMLYNHWLGCKNAIVTDVAHTDGKYKWCCGASTLYPPFVFGTYALKHINVQYNNNDDAYLCACANRLNIPVVAMNIPLCNYSVFHDMNQPLSANGYNATDDIIRYLNLVKCDE